MYGLVSRALHLLLHFSISEGALVAGISTEIEVLVNCIYTTFESSSLARVSCFLMLLWVLKDAIGLFGKTVQNVVGIFR